MKDLGPAKKILGIEIQRDRSKRQLFLCPIDYLKRVLKRFHMDQCKSVRVPLSSNFKLSLNQSPSTKAEKIEMGGVPYSTVVGSIMYSMICTRPDLAYALSLSSKFMSNPGKAHWCAVKHMLRYIQGTLCCGLVYGGASGSEGLRIEGFVDPDYVADLDKRSSRTGYVFKLHGNTVSWKSSLQSIVALSSTESEYVALADATKEALWMQGLVSEITGNVYSVTINCVTINCDSQSAIHLSKNQVHYERTKHIDIKLHFVREIFAKDLFELNKVDTSENAADMLTKPVPLQKLIVCCNLLKLIAEGA